MPDRTYSQQKAALTRAIKKGGQAVIAECMKVKVEWDASYWPDDWSRWQRALSDTNPGEFLNLDDL